MSGTFWSNLLTGIYVFGNKLERHPVKDVDIAFLTVYYHEVAHLAIHNTALHPTFLRYIICVENDVLSLRAGQYFSN